MSEIKDQVANKVMEILTSIQTQVGQGVDFAKEQLPDIAQQFIKYGTISSLVETIIFFVFLCVSIISLFIAYKDSKKKYDQQREELQVLGFVAGSIGLLVTTIGFFYNLFKFIFVYTAPKVWLLKEIVYLFK